MRIGLLLLLLAGCESRNDRIHREMDEQAEEKRIAEATQRDAPPLLVPPPQPQKVGDVKIWNAATWFVRSNVKADVDIIDKNILAERPPLYLVGVEFNLLGRRQEVTVLVMANTDSGEAMGAKAYPGLMTKDAAEKFFVDADKKTSRGKKH